MARRPRRQPSPYSLQWQQKISLNRFHLYKILLSIKLVLRNGQPRLDHRYGRWECPPMPVYPQQPWGQATGYWHAHISPLATVLCGARDPVALCPRPVHAFVPCSWATELTSRNRMLTSCWQLFGWPRLRLRLCSPKCHHREKKKLSGHHA